MGAGTVIPMKGQDCSPSYFLLHGPHVVCFHLIISAVPRANLDLGFISSLWMPLQTGVLPWSQGDWRREHSALGLCCLRESGSRVCGEMWEGSWRTGVGAQSGGSPRSKVMPPHPPGPPRWHSDT